MSRLPWEHADIHAATTTQTHTYRKDLLSLWHVCSLDAPVVAFVWTLLLGGTAAPIRYAAVTLSIAVWMLYITDRLFDARQTNATLQERHLFHRTYAHRFHLLLAFLAPFLMWLLWHVQPEIRGDWILLLLPLTLYFAAIHLLHARMPKEFLVAVFFSITCSVPNIVQHGMATAWPGILLFGLLCWSNCVAIARWESIEQPAADLPTRAVADLFHALCWITILLATLLGFWLHLTALAACCVLSTVALFALDLAHKGIAPVSLRALADAALLSPLAVLLVVTNHLSLPTILSQTAHTR